MGKKIIIVDDAPFIREVVRQILTETDHDVIAEAKDGEEAIQKAIELQPDIILMDIVMPKKSGIDATREILEELPNMKIIAFSTVDQETMVMKALEAGCCHYLTKPFTAEDIVSAVESA